MLEINVKNWEKSVFEKGIEKGIGQGIEKGFMIGVEKRDLEITKKMIENGMSNSDIQKITGMSISKIVQIRKKCR